MSDQDRDPYDPQGFYGAVGARAMTEPKTEAGRRLLDKLRRKERL